MKTLDSIPIAISLSLAAAAAPGDYTAVERGPHHRVCQRTVERTLPDGRTVTEKHAYTALATGMNRYEGGQWVPAQAVIEPLRDGAAARLTQNTIVFANNLNTRGAIDMFTVDGKRLTSHVLGIFYTDLASGKSVLLSQVKDSVAEIHLPNRLVYADAFSGVRADVEYVVTLAGMEQLIILREAPPPPQSFGMNPKTVRLLRNYSSVACWK